LTDASQSLSKLNGYLLSVGSSKRHYRSLRVHSRCIRLNTQDWLIFAKIMDEHHNDQDMRFQLSALQVFLLVTMSHLYSSSQFISSLCVKCRRTCRFERLIQRRNDLVDFALWNANK